MLFKNHIFQFDSFCAPDFFENVKQAAVFENHGFSFKIFIYFQLDNDTLKNFNIMRTVSGAHLFIKFGFADNNIDIVITALKIIVIFSAVIIWQNIGSD